MTHSVNGVSQDTERKAFEAHLKRMPTWAPEFEKHRGWVDMFAWDVWQARAAIAVQPPAASEPVIAVTVKRWCETCEGTGYVFQEPQAGCHVDGDHPCPDCDGKGYWVPAQPPAASQPSERHATLRYERGTPGKENDMPSVVSCNWLPDSDYAVYLAMPQPPAASEIKTKQVWVAWTNTDLAEGRGHEIPLAVCETEGTARRLGVKGYVMGTQCPVTECTAILSGCHWLVPGRIIAPTMEDQRLSQLYADQRAAVERAKAAGLSVEDLKLLGAS